jgi:hypothetical protein
LQVGWRRLKHSPSRLLSVGLASDAATLPRAATCCSNAGGSSTVGRQLAIAAAPVTLSSGAATHEPSERVGHSATELESCGSSNATDCSLEPLSFRRRLLGETWDATWMVLRFMLLAFFLSADQALCSLGVGRGPAGQPQSMGHPLCSAAWCASLRQQSDRLAHDQRPVGSGHEPVCRAGLSHLWPHDDSAGHGGPVGSSLAPSLCPVCLVFLAGCGRTGVRSQPGDDSVLRALLNEEVSRIIGERP